MPTEIRFSPPALATLPGIDPVGLCLLPSFLVTGQEECIPALRPSWQENNLQILCCGCQLYPQDSKADRIAKHGSVGLMTHKDNWAAAQSENTQLTSEVPTQQI